MPRKKYLKKPKDPRKIRCQCGYCGADSTSGVFFLPKYKGQKYANKNHYIRHQYKGKLPIRRKCKCGCGRVFHTIDKYKYYIEGHQLIYECCLCASLVDKDNVIIKTMNKEKFFFCEKCYEELKKHG